jgi:uncharacterized DUF497 family protein
VGRRQQREELAEARVSHEEAEQVFSNRPLVVTLATDEDASGAGELRDLALGLTDADRWLFVAFTIRANSSASSQSGT